VQHIASVKGAEFVSTLEELSVHARYRERVEQAEALSLPDVAECLATLLQQTQEHARDLRAALG
jgi:bacterioferritin